MKRIVFYLFFVSLFTFNYLNAETSMRSFYPPIEPHHTGFLDVDAEHSLYWEECGNPDGDPIVFLHGGPGMGCSKNARQFFDPRYFRIILFDQRGSGKSKPFASLNQNTTWDLVADMEKLRRYFNVEKWHLFGGSWGSTLALCYAIKHPERVKSLTLRGIYLCRQKEIDWFYQEGVNRFFPDAWERYVAPIPIAERRNFVNAFYKRLTSDDPQVRLSAAKAWAGWEAETSKLFFDQKSYDYLTEDKMAEAFARIECHYFYHHTFLQSDNWILENISTILSIPCTIVHGRYDMPCSFENAWELHQLLPGSRLELIPDAGHAATEPGILDALIRATDSLKEGR